MNRIVGHLKTAVTQSGLTDGDRISFHHHLRLGDRVVEQVLACLSEMGFKSLTLCLSSVMGPACGALLEAVRSGLVCRIETTGMKEPLSSAVLAGEIPEPVVFRTHGGRARALREGEIPIDLAFLAVSIADGEGNGNGTGGSNRFGSLGYALVDAAYAEKVILITDTLSAHPLPLEERSIRGDDRCLVVKVDSIGDREKIAGGSLRVSRRPVEKVIARKAFEVLKASGHLCPGFSYQSGSGGISLLVSSYVADYMRQKAIVGSFASGGVTGALTGLLEEGLFEKLYDVQSFDDEAALSLKRNPDHLEMSASFYADPGDPECIAHRLDVMLLSATEADVDFNLNSITGTNGRILGALGGAPDTAEGSKLTIAVLPAFRGRIPTLHQRVNLICTPGRYVDIIVTERGVAVNPARRELEARLNRRGIKTLLIEELKDLVYDLTGTPEAGDFRGRIVGLVESRHGGVLDTIRMKAL